MPRRLLATRTHATLWLGLLAVVIGAVLVLTAPPSSSGWFAFAPQSDYAFVAGTRPWQLTAGPVLVLVGVIAAAFTLGRLSVRRSR
ncbi:hypothetical protein DEJ28_01525 [Curtobacterium sp. MCPF17_002]|uniref:hypothetical protein n=1 Tax=Curtobacterium sp. MCPF17_002 TaxID=2175645 RepID=UPI000DAA517F|nr:hypothetical protein [Curtobacterium sp. MCPF17_002]WIB77802.1 hypothetical protein DEJ28_01525 [Curtobacterium sp. MCPF17_002]